MFVHVTYGSERGDHVMEFNSSSFTTVNYVLGKVSHGDGGYTLQLYNEHGRELDSGEVVENGRVCVVKRMPLEM